MGPTHERNDDLVDEDTDGPTDRFAKTVLRRVREEIDAEVDPLRERIADLEQRIDRLEGGGQADERE